MTPRTVQQLFDLGGKTALITGGSRGLGLQIAHALGEAGARLMLAARHADELEVAVQELQAAGLDARWIAADCAREDDLRRLGSETLERMGEVDILVNNAGTCSSAPAEAPPIEARDPAMNLDPRGYFLLSQYIGKHSMIPRRSGSIINISPLAGNTAQAAVLNFTRALATEWGRHGIRVNAICPGLFPTRLTRGAIAAQGGSEALAARVPLRRLGDDEDLKGLALLYASDAGKHITGQWLAVDGGASAIVEI